MARIDLIGVALQCSQTQIINPPLPAAQIKKKNKVFIVSGDVVGLNYSFIIISLFSFLYSLEIMMFFFSIL